MPYIKILKFLIKGNLRRLIPFWEDELLRGKESFSWYKIYRYYKKAKDNNNLNDTFWFWWRLANEMYCCGNGSSRKGARRIQRKLISDYNIEIMFGAKIGARPLIRHFSGIVISKAVTIGDNIEIRQNTTIGVKNLGELPSSTEKTIVIGNNVTIGANSCIIGDSLIIGDNVTIGAMSLVNKDIPSGCTYYSKREAVYILREG